jgi:hypothetical protein
MGNDAPATPDVLAVQRAARRSGHLVVSGGEQEYGFTKIMMLYDRTGRLWNAVHGAKNETFGKCEPVHRTRNRK